MQFNFSDVWWLALVLAIPAVTALYALYYRGRIALERLKAFADTHLLPHLLKDKTGMQQSVARPLILWSIVWACGTLAMAGPRWNYTDIQTGMPNRSLVILLDLSKSMDAQDVKPSRIERAKEEIGDVIDASHGTNIGLIAFAAIPHMVVPLTDDMATIRYLMPSLDTSLVGMQGSRLAPALEMAGLMLRGAPGKDKSILVVSDGGMEDLAEATQTIPEGVRVYAMGIGTPEGAPIPNDGGGFIERRNGEVVIATLGADKLKAITDTGKGIYVTADYTDSDTRALLSHIEAGPETGLTKKGRMVRIWDEKFYIPALIMALVMLPWFRRGYVFPIILILTLWPAPARADLGDLFMNQAQQARAAYDQRDYDGAAQKFDTPYRKGVAQYRAQQFDKAEQSFAQDNDPATKVDSEYNKGNAQLMQGKADDAIASYEDVLRQRPDDKAAAKNLEIAKKLREQQQKKDDNRQDQKKDQQKDAKNDEKQDQKQDKKQDQKQQQQQQAQNNQQQNQKQGKSGDQQQSDKQGQQQQKDQSGEKQRQDKQGEQQQNGQQQQADNGQPQDKQQQGRQSQEQPAQSGQQGQQDQKQNAQNQDNQQRRSQGSQDQDKQRQAQNGQGGQQGQQHDEQHQGQPDNGKGQQPAQNGDNKDGNGNNQPQDQKGAADRKNAQNNQKSPPQPGSEEDKKNRAEQEGASEKQAQDQKGGDMDKQQAAQQGKQEDRAATADQAQKKQEEDKQQQQEQAGQQAKDGGDRQVQKQEQAAGQGNQDKGQTSDRQQPSYTQSNQDNSAQQQQVYDSGQQTEGQKSGKGQPGNVLNGQQRPRSQKDVDADQWLNRAVSDPGPFLKNQFNIDARKNPQPEEEDPW